jgi:hypothetical protein
MAARPSFGEAVEVMRPDARLLETTKEALDEAILVGRIGGNEPVAEPVIAASAGKHRLWKIKLLSLRPLAGPYGALSA